MPFANGITNCCAIQESKFGFEGVQYTSFRLSMLLSVCPCLLCFMLEIMNFEVLTHKTRVLVGKPEGRRPLGRPRRRWVYNIRMDLQEVGCGYVDWIGLAQDRDRWRTLVSAVMNLRVPWNAGNLLTSCRTVSCSGRTLHHGVSK